MRKGILSLLIMGLLIGGTFQKIQAQDKTKSFNLNIGVMTTDYFKRGRNGLIFGIGFDFRLGKSISICPEIQYWNDKSLFGNYSLVLGIILNFNVKYFFLGGGAVLPLESKYILPKMNAGLMIKNTKLTFFLVPFFEHGYFDVESILFGASIGLVL